MFKVLFLHLPCKWMQLNEVISVLDLVKHEPFSILCVLVFINSVHECFMLSFLNIFCGLLQFSFHVPAKPADSRDCDVSVYSAKYHFSEDLRWSLDRKLIIMCIKIIEKKQQTMTANIMKSYIVPAMMKFNIKFVKYCFCVGWPIHWYHNYNHFKTLLKNIDFNYDLLVLSKICNLNYTGLQLHHQFMFWFEILSNRNTLVSINLICTYPQL